MTKQQTVSSDAGFLLSGMITWIVSSLLLLLLSAAAVYIFKPGEASFGYIISAISFLSSAAAGFSAGRKRRKAALFTGLIIGCAVICFALMLGFLIDGNRITADSVLSLVTFTLAGCITGCILPNEKTKKKKKKTSFLRKKS